MSQFSVFNPEEVKWKDFGVGEPKTAIFQGSDHLTIQYFELPGKSAGAPHIHAEEQIVYVVRGHMGIHYDGQDYFAPQGCLVCIPANVEHYGFNPSNETAVTLEIFLPKRASQQSEKVDDFSICR